MKSNVQHKITVPFLLRFTLPSMVMMVVMSLYSVVDGIFVSRFIGTDAFSAVILVYPLFSLAIGIGTMFGAGLTAIVAQKLGEGKNLEAKQVLTFVILAALIVGLIMSAAAGIFLKPVLHLLGANNQVYDYCWAYAFPLVFFMSVNVLQLMFQNLYVADGKPAIGLILTVLGGLTNVVLDYVFIVKLNMGIAGAAIATGIGNTVPTVFGLCYFAFHRHGSLYFVKPIAAFKALLHTITNGSSEMVSYLSSAVTTFLFNVIMMRLLGQDGVAAIAILLYLDFVLVAVSLGYSMGIAPLISFNHGCGNSQKLKKIFRISLVMSFVLGLVVTGFTLLGAPLLTSIFTPKTNPVYALAVSGLRLYAFSYLFKGCNVFASAMFTAFNNGRVSAILSALRTLVFLTLSLLTLSFFFGVTGVFIAAPIAELLALGTAILYLLKYRKKYGYGSQALLAA